MTLVILAFAVAMDCTAVSAAYSLRRISASDLARLAATFGAFQAATAFVGALGGTALTRYLGGWDAWIAFGLLLGVGGHMIFEALFEDADEEATAAPELSLVSLTALGVATSIDSLAVGATLPTLGLPIALSASTIGLVSFLMAYVGAWGGTRAGARFGPSVEILGGVVLIAIGVHAVWPQVTT